MGGLGDTFTGCNFDTNPRKGRAEVGYTHSHRQEWTPAGNILQGMSSRKTRGRDGSGGPGYWYSLGGTPDVRITTKSEALAGLHEVALTEIGLQRGSYSIK